MKIQIKKIKAFLFITFLLFTGRASAQFVSGRVANEQGEPLAGANDYWLGSTTAL